MKKPRPVVKSHFENVVVGDIISVPVRRRDFIDCYWIKATTISTLFIIIHGPWLLPDSSTTSVDFPKLEQMITRMVSCVDGRPFSQGMWSTISLQEEGGTAPTNMAHSSESTAVEVFFKTRFCSTKQWEQRRSQPQ
jgi:hypothetical protein